MTPLLNIVLLPFFQRSLFVGCILGVLLAILGVFVLARRLTFFADAIGHSALTGIALGLLLGFNPFVSGLLFALLVAVGISQVERRSRLPLDTLLGVFFATAVAVGVIVIQRIPGYQTNLINFLFGDILTVGADDVMVTALLAVAIVGILVYAGKKLIAITFSPDIAQTDGIAVKRYELLFLLMLAATIALAIKLVGIILVTALVVIPAATAQNLARSLTTFFTLSACFGFLATLIGMLGSVVVNTPSGPTIIVVSAFFFTLSLLARR